MIYFPPLPSQALASLSHLPPNTKIQQEDNNFPAMLFIKPDFNVIAMERERGAVPTKPIRRSDYSRWHTLHFMYIFFRSFELFEEQRAAHVEIQCQSRNVSNK